MAGTGAAPPAADALVPGEGVTPGIGAAPPGPGGTVPSPPMPDHRPGSWSSMGRGSRAGLIALLVVALVGVRLLFALATSADVWDALLHMDADHATPAPITGVKTYTNPDAGYSITYPARYEQVEPDPGDFDPESSVRLVDRTDLVVDEPATTVIVNAKRYAQALTKKQAARSVRQLVRTLGSAPEDDPEAEIWDSRLIRAEVSRMAGRPCFIKEFTCRSGDGGRAHYLFCVFDVRDQRFAIQVSASEARWPQVQEEFRQMMASFELL
jgi:hypothetical protein